MEKYSDCFGLVFRPTGHEKRYFMFEKISTFLEIPYVKLHFTVQMTEDCRLPVTKASALRGGTGQMMIRQNCIVADHSLKEEDCRHCDCLSECPVQRFLYTPMEIQPNLSADRLSMGYLFECENYEEWFREGDLLDFNVTLFGKSRVYLNLLLQAVWDLGNTGLGKEKAGHFRILRILNSRKQTIMDMNRYGTQILKQAYRTEYVSEYVEYRMHQIEEQGLNNIIRFQTETTLKYKKELQQEFSMEAIVSNLARRIYLFNCFVGREMDPEELTNHLMENLPIIVEQDIRKRRVARYSSRQQSRMQLQGIQGNVYLGEWPDEDLLRCLLAGEILHIGKNTSFGFGRYRVM